MDKTNIERLKELLTIIGCVALYCLVLTILNITCPIKYVTGISCAGCGMSRAFLSLIKGNITDAFNYHPLFWTVPIFVIIYIYRDKIPSKVFKVVVAVYLIAFIVCYIIRLLNPNDLIVVCDLKESVFYRLFKGGL